MIRILDVRVDEYDMDESLDLIGAFVAQGSGFHQVITINPEGVMLARADAQLAQVVEQAALVTPDGNGVLWAAARLGRPLRQRVTGVDLLERLCARAAQEGWRVYLLGGQPGVANDAAAALQQRYPGLIVAGCDDGYFRQREADAIAQAAQARAHILFAGLGMPYQELWLHQHGAELGCCVAVGVGGSFDVLSGRVKRAPLLWQKLKLEWLWRLLSEPKRWRRYLAIPRFMLAVRREARQKK